MKDMKHKFEPKLKTKHDSNKVNDNCLRSPSGLHYGQFNII